VKQKRGERRGGREREKERGPVSGWEGVGRGGREPVCVLFVAPRYLHRCRYLGATLAMCVGGWGGGVSGTW
jgi:hypothetical protein